MLVISLILLFAASILTFITPQWRWKLASLALCYFFAFVLVTQSWPIGLAAVKVISGWVACSMLAFTEWSMEDRDTSQNIETSGGSFKMLLIVLVAIIALAIAPQLENWIPSISIYQASGALLLIGIGLIGVSLDSRILPTVVGLLLIFAGFEIIYSVVEVSSLLAGLLAVISLGIALVGAYLILLPALEKAE